MDEEGSRNASRPKLDPHGGSCGGAVDLISALPDDLLLQVLGRLGSVAAAACTGVVSRRWRDLWARLPKVTVALHDDVPFGSLEHALRRAAVRPGLCHFLLDIRVPEQDDDMVSGSTISSLLHAAAGLSPAELRFTLPSNSKLYHRDVELPCFRRATSIELQAPDLRLSLRMASWGQYHSLERLSLSGCRIDLATFIPRCPRLRLLTLNTTDLTDMPYITIHSASLEELVFEHKNPCADLSLISVDAPALKRLTTSFHARDDVSVSILAPMVDMVAWQCLYTRVIYGIGLWGLSEVGFVTRGRQGRTDSAEDDACLQHALSLHMCAQDSFVSANAELSFVADVDKHIITNFSSLDLHLKTKGHVFGAFVLHLIGMHRIRTAIRNLKIFLLRSEVKDTCSAHCHCDEPKEKRTQSISLPGLEKVDIECVKGEDHEFDFVELIFRCAPILKHVTLKLSDGVTPSANWCTKIKNIVKAYPAVEFNIDLGPGSTRSCHSGVST